MQVFSGRNDGMNYANSEDKPERYGRPRAGALAKPGELSEGWERGKRYPLFLGIFLVSR
jgi:hypothetical protein